MERRYVDTGDARFGICGVSGLNDGGGELMHVTPRNCLSHLPPCSIRGDTGSDPYTVFGIPCFRPREGDLEQQKRMQR